MYRPGAGLGKGEVSDMASQGLTSGRLAGQVALVSGATRGAGRGIARSLGAEGAIVYCTGRSTREAAATPGRPETIEQTAELIAQAGGTGIAVRVDHTREDEVAALIQRIEADHDRLDILVNDVWGGDALINWSVQFWGLDMRAVTTLMERSIFSHILTARYATPLIMKGERGLIVEVTDGELAGYRGQLLYDLVKSSVNRLAYAMAWDLARTKVTALAVSPGFLRSEAMLDNFGVTEANWRDAIAKNAPFAESETPLFVGRAVAALAADPDVGRWAGQALSAADLGKVYGFTDIDGRSPAFWDAVEAGLAVKLDQNGRYPPEARRMAMTRYTHTHLTPSLAPRARELAAQLGLEGLGAGLRPII
jgi:NAD(P)-dependent dehydrogenase (short-subunit alcohol dehydrogenase family)